MKRMILRALISLSSVTGTALAQTVLHVDAQATTPPHDGSDWCHAFLELHEALAGVSGDTVIRVADGAYLPDTTGLAEPRDATFALRDGVALEGGYAGCGAPDPGARDMALYETTLTGDIGVPDDPADNCFHVVTATDVADTAILDGFTITAGNAGAANGGGMFIAQGEPTIIRCTLFENSADYGGGVFNSHGRPRLTECTFDHNTAGASGGGMYNFSFPGEPAATLMSCAFNENTAEHYGGGMRNWDSSPALTDCTLHYNHARISGAGMANGGASDPVIKGCMFQSNRADTLFGNWDSSGGGVSNTDDASPTFINCVFHANSAHAMLPWLSHGGAIASTGQATPLLINCTMIANHANIGDGLHTRDSALATVANSILRDGDDDDEIIFEDNSWIDARYSNIQGYWPGPGNIDADPQLQDLKLLPGSPCIDAGDNSALPPEVTTDFDGNARFVDDPSTIDTGFGTSPLADMGATEYQTQAGCAEDLQFPAGVEQQDLNAVLNRWGDPDCLPGGLAFPCPEDLALPEGVEQQDLNAVLNRWGDPDCL